MLFADTQMSQVNAHNNKKIKNKNKTHIFSTRLMVHSGIIHLLKNVNETTMCGH